MEFSICSIKFKEEYPLSNSTHKCEVLVRVILRVSVATDAEVDLQLREGFLQLRSQPVVSISSSSVEIRIQWDNFKGLSLDPRESVNQMGAEGQRWTHVV